MAGKKPTRQRKIAPYRRKHIENQPLARRLTGSSGRELAAESVLAESAYGWLLYLAAVELDLAALPLGGFYEHIIDKVLSIDGPNQGTIYAVAIGARPGERNGTK